MKVTRLTADGTHEDLLQILSGDSLLLSKAFASLWAPLSGRVVYWAAHADSKIVALLMGVEFGMRPVRRFQSMPDGLGSRVLLRAGDTALHDQAAEVILDAIAKAGYLKAHFTDFDNRYKTFTNYSALACSTTIIGISGAEWTPPDKKLQSELRKAAREQVTIQRFRSESHMKGFMRLMEATERRHKRKLTYSARFYQGLAALAARDDRIIWLWCDHEGQPVVSHICLVEGTTALHWQVCYDKAFSNLKANQYMLWDLIRRLRERGVIRLNLGASPDDAQGLLEYKSKWGGESHAYNCHIFKSWLGRWL
ncbi:MAG: GNAT family N-acetyltransferase [candidate division Zixibacteria bacterium]|nr:GNAT family N-acetyltransferase [candidate division Zixibacteria bacterium]MDH3935951.1 GNAT family N-acetyltransferase [candidate division Zixibacteria bacterium]MDH4034438.1 GNAT family N-acetyltransferase [candidate division Zixibacteria bacterium]